ncbi:DNA polymerase III subunit alpha [Candidatus Berkelbacteria bacterium]|nr:DNA polymerase III subunit alpha [Candidatus Berkelbacteria bacterium]
MAFVHLHVHSHFSLLDGLAKVPDLITRAKELGQEAIALTDHGAMYGVIEFYRAAQAAEIKPIIGAEIYIAPRGMTDKEPKLDTRPYHLTVLAKNEQGYRNLMKLVSEGHLTGFYYKPRVDKTLLKKHSEGLIALSGCPAAEIPRLLQEANYERAKIVANDYITIFGQKNFFFEIQPHPEIPEQALTNQGILKLSEELKIPLVATNDTHYINLKDKHAHEVLLAIQTGRDVDDQTRLTMQATDLHLASEQEMREKFPDLPQAIENTIKVAELCDLKIPLGQLILPHFAVPTKQKALDYLRTQTEKGFEIRYGRGTPEARERLEYELSVIGKTGFPEYFLIVADIVNWAKGQGIWVGPGRGSAAGSIVSYCLNITDLDPIHYRLIFERFLNPERIAPPDIDLDFADDRRDEVIAYIVKKYGHDHVDQIITFGVMKARLATRDVTRALGYPYALGDRIAKLVPFGSDLEQGMKQVPDLMALYNQDPSAKKVIDMSFQLEGVVRHASTHAAGVVISKEPLVNYTPLQRSTTGEGITTQYSMYDVEVIGLLKMDILGLTNLTILKRCRDFVKQYYNEDIDLKNIPLDDTETYKLLASAETIGVFQLESDGMRRYIKELKPTNIEDIMAMISLYRPGPMEFIPDYIAGKHGKRKPTYLHPKLEPILKDTYGIAVYQEQVLQIARDIAGFSLGEADVLRMAIGKKIKKLLLEQRKKFIDSAINQGVAKAIAEKLFDYTEPFARYGFNRCLTGDTEIVDPKTGELLTLDQIAKGQRKNLKVFSTHPDLKIKNGNVIEVFDNGQKAVFELKTQLGKTITATANHPFLAIGGWRLLEDLTVGDRIAVAREIPFKKGISLPKHQLSLIGYLLAEGNLCHPHGFYFYSKDKREVTDFVDNLKRFRNSTATEDHKKSAISVYSRRINLKQPSEAVEWVKSLGMYGKTAVNKHFPEIVFRLDRASLAVVLAKFFQGDGCINLKRQDPQIFFATSSKQLASELQHLLLRLGIVSKIHHKLFKYRGTLKPGYTLTISRFTNIKRLLEQFSPHLIGPKQQLAKKILKSHPIISGRIRQHAARGSKDIIPAEILPLIKREIISAGYGIREFSRRFGLAQGLFCRDKRKQGFLRETVQKIAQVLKSSSLAQLAQSDIYWDRVVAIKSVGVKQTYEVEKLGSIVAEGQRLGLKVLLPDVNASATDFIVETKGQIRYGLSAIKNVGGKAAEAIVAERTTGGRFDSLADLITRLPQDTVNKKVVESLACAGALDSLAERNQVLSSMDTILKFAGKKSYQRGQESLFGGGEGGKMELRLAEVAPAANEQKLAWEKEYLGAYFSATSGSNINQTAQAAVGDDITVSGIVSGIKPITTRSGTPMGFVTLEDQTHTIEVVVFPRLWQERSGLIVAGKVVRARGRYDLKDGQPKLLAEDISESSAAAPDRLKIIITNGFAKDHLVQLKELLAASPGEVSVELEIRSVSGVKNLTVKQRVAVSDDLLAQLQSLVGEDNVVLDR